MSNSLESGQDVGLAVPTRLVVNAVWNVLAFAIALAANFLTIPYVMHEIGVTEFGAGGLVIAVFAPFMLVGTVLGQALIRVCAPSLERRDYKHGSRVFVAVLTLCLCCCALVAILAAGIAVGARHVGVGDGIGSIDWATGVAICYVGWVAQQFTFLFQAITAASQRYLTVLIISTLASVLSAGAIVSVVSYMPTAAGFMAGTSLGYTLSLAAWWLLVHREQAWLRNWQWPTRNDYRAIVDFSKWQGLAHFIGSIGLQMDRYTLGALMPLAVVGSYNVAMRLQEVVHMIVLKAGEVLFPHFSATSSNDIEKKVHFYVASSWVISTFAVCVLGPLIPLSLEVLTLWVGPDVASAASPILQTLALAGVFGASTNVFSYHMMGIGENAVLARLMVVHAFLTILMSLIFISTLGVVAAGFGVLMANIVRLGLVVMLARRHFSQLENGDVLIVGGVAPVVGGVIACTLWNRWAAVSPTTWVGVGAWYVAIGVSVAISAVLVTAMSRIGRQLIGEALWKAVRHMSERG